MDKFQKGHKLLKLTQEQIDNLNRSITSEETELVLKENSGPDGFTTEFYQIYKEELIPILDNSSKYRMQGKLLNSFNEASIISIVKLDKDITRKENYGPISLINMNSKIHKIVAN